MAVTFLALASALWATSADVRSFDIPAGPAEITLKTFSAQAGVEVLFATATVTSVRTNAVQGRHLPSEAIHRLLQGTGLVAWVETGGTFTITRERNRSKTPPPAPEPKSARPPPAASSLSGSTQRPTSTMKPKHTKNPITLLAGWLALATGPLYAAESTVPQSSSGQEDVVSLSLFEVTSDRDEGYRSTQTISGFGTVENLRNTPYSISVLNEELINDLMVGAIEELTEFAIAGQPSDANESIVPRFEYRGIVGGQALRNGVPWWGSIDAYSIERVEVLRGPSAFLYGEGTPGGVLNRMTKSPRGHNFQNASLILGSYNMKRFQFDLNRRITSQIAARVALGWEDREAFANHSGRKYKGAYVAVSYQPFKNTRITWNGEVTRNFENRPMDILAERYSTTDRTNATSAYGLTNGGYTFIPADNRFYRTVGTGITARRFSQGTNMAIIDQDLMSPLVNFQGPDSYYKHHTANTQIQIEQKVTERLTLEGSYTYQTLFMSYVNRMGTQFNGLYRDVNPTLPDGTTNPRFGELYTEGVFRRVVQPGTQRDWRIRAIYDLKLPFTTQRIILTGGNRDDSPSLTQYAEFVDPNNPVFQGSLINANTRAAYTANLTTMNQNYFYRRFYLNDGDGARITSFNPIPGQSIFTRNPVPDSATGRTTNRIFRMPHYGAGASGSWFGGRVMTLVGWRHDSFIQDLERDFFNVVTGESYRLPDSVHLRTRVHKASSNFGGVVHVAKWLSLYANWAESVNLSSGLGGNTLRPGGIRGLQNGDGWEFGARWTFLDGRLESNWTYYITNSLNVGVTPPTNVRTGELEGLFPAEINSAGTDTETRKATGFEFETVTNITRNWRLTWNFSTNDIETSERYPATHYFQALARERGLLTPNTDDFLAANPAGTPIPGFIKIRSNLITQYQFRNGPLKGFNFGTALQYRDRAYRGNFDLDRDGTAEMQWTPGFFIVNLMSGYRTRIWDRNVSFNLNVSNVLNEQYFISRRLNAGRWGPERSWRFATRIDL